jgi:hypothetical protein
MPIVTSIKIWRGEDITLSFTETPPRDITGWVISFTVAKAFNVPNKTMQVTATITSGPNGQYDVVLPSAITNIQPDKYVWDVFRIAPGNRRILGLGNFLIDGDVQFP